MALSQFDVPATRKIIAYGPMRGFLVRLLSSLLHIPCTTPFLGFNGLFRAEETPRQTNGSL